MTRFAKGTVLVLALLTAAPGVLAAQWYHFDCNPLISVVKPDGYWTTGMEAAIYFTPEDATGGDGAPTGDFTIDEVNVFVNEDGGIPAGGPGSHIQTVDIRIYAAGAGGLDNPAPGTLLWVNEFWIGDSLDSNCVSGCPLGTYVTLPIETTPYFDKPVFQANQDFIVAVYYPADGIFSYSQPSMGHCSDGYNGDVPAEKRYRIREGLPLSWKYTDGLSSPNDFTGDFIMDLVTSDAPEKVIPTMTEWGLMILLTSLGGAMARSLRKRRS